MDAYTLASNSYEMRDFLDLSVYNHHFGDLIRGENENSYAGSNFTLFNTYVEQKNISPRITGDHLFDFNASGDGMVPDANYNYNGMSGFNGEMEGEEEDEDEEDEDSSGTTTTVSNGKKKSDRSKVLVSERKRRGRMKEKLYALRSLVPNITKMDKASIIGDAVLYLQDLQTQAKQLNAEIKELEASTNASKRYQEPRKNTKNVQFSANRQPVSKKIITMDVFQVEERGFYVKILCNRGEGVAVSLYKALESFNSFKIQNSNLATISGSYALTFNIRGNDSKQAMNLQNLKLWVTGALLNEGFEFIGS